jgi:hypothetical protein
MAAYGWIAFRFGTLHLTVAACVAPFLLLRTERSTQLALTWWSALFRNRSRGTRAYKVMSGLALAGIGGPLLLVAAFIDDPAVRQMTAAWSDMSQAAAAALMLVLGFTALPVAVLLLLPATVIRVASTITQTLRSPPSALRSIPRNWWRIAVCTDLGVLPEMIPGAYAYLSALPMTSLLVPTEAAQYITREIEESHTRDVHRAAQDWTARQLQTDAVLARLQDRPAWLRPIVRGVGALDVLKARADLFGERYGSRALLSVLSFAFRACVVLMCLPSWLYRWSVKGTTWLLAPLPCKPGGSGSVLLVRSFPRGGSLHPATTWRSGHGSATPITT